MEGSQRGRVEACAGVLGLLEEQRRVEPSGRTIAASSHPRGEMGDYLHGLHHRTLLSTREGLYFCGGGPSDQVCTFLCHSDTIFNFTGGKVVL